MTATTAKKNILTEIKDNCALIAKQAGHVRICAEKIPDYINRLLDQYAITTELDDNHFLSDDTEKTACYILALDSLNFGSGYLRQVRDEGISFDYTIFARGLKNAFMRNELDTPEKWQKVKPADFHKIFDIPTGANVAIDRLFELFACHLKQTGEIILKDYQGKALKLVASAKGSAASLVETLAAWPTFKDIGEYKGQAAPLLKRAQIFAADLHLAKVTTFNDIGELTVFADNRVPHVLLCDGILEYSAALGQKIEGLTPLQAGSPEEIELRAVTIHAVELMRQAALEKGRNVTSVNIDHILWRRGAEPAISALPTHRTLTVWY